MTQPAPEQKLVIRKGPVALAFAFLVLVNVLIAAAFMWKKNPAQVEPYPSVVSRTAVAHAKTVFEPGKSPGFLRAAQSPAMFRSLDRVYRFDALYLDGEPARYRELLRHFRESKDWQPVHVDPVAIVLIRSPQVVWTPDSLRIVRSQIATLPTDSQPAMLVLLANRLGTLGEMKSARTLIDDALQVAPDSAEVRAQLASWFAQTAQWNEALDHARKALALSKNLPAALTVQAQAFLALGKFEEAFNASSLLMKTPAADEPQALFLHARIAHEAHAYWHEIDALQKLLTVAEKAQAPTSAYRIYLAQALAKRSEPGDGREAVRQLEASLAEGDLSENQKQFAEETLAQIKSQIAPTD